MEAAPEKHKHTIGRPARSFRSSSARAQNGLASRTSVLRLKIVYISPLKAVKMFEYPEKGCRRRTISLLRSAEASDHCVRLQLSKNLPYVAANLEFLPRTWEYLCRIPFKISLMLEGHVSVASFNDWPDWWIGSRVTPREFGAV
jgi:hypothetical protein